MENCCASSATASLGLVGVCAFSSNLEIGVCRLAQPGQTAGWSVDIMPLLLVFPLAWLAGEPEKKVSGQEICPMEQVP